MGDFNQKYFMMINGVIGDVSWPAALTGAVKLNMLIWPGSATTQSRVTAMVPGQMETRRPPAIDVNSFPDLPSRSAPNDLVVVSADVGKHTDQLMWLANGGGKGKPFNVEFWIEYQPNLFMRGVLTKATIAERRYHGGFDGFVPTRSEAYGFRAASGQVRPVQSPRSDRSPPTGRP